MSDDSPESIERARGVGHDVLGPVFHLYLRRLRQRYDFLAAERDATALYVLRAGVRIRALQERAGLAAGFQRWSYFSGSRMAIAKGTYLRSPGPALAALMSELRNVSLAELVRALVSSDADAPAQLGDLSSLAGRRSSDLPGFLAEASDASRIVRRYLEEQGAFLDEYLGAIAPPGTTTALLDSGWQGTGQALLKHAYPDRTFVGLYFGRSYLPNADRSLASEMSGLVFEADAYDPARPETSIVFHRHLVESLLEPNHPSIEQLERGAEGVFAPGLDGLLMARTDEGCLGGLWDGLSSYLASRDPELPWRRVLADFDEASRALRKMLVSPSPSDAFVLQGKARSADLGRTSFRVPVLLRTRSRWAGDSSAKRIADSLWPQGQAAIEYGDGPNASVQEALTHARLEPRSSDLRGAASWSGPPRVAVITRTKNREVLLRRAARSVAQQTLEDYEWIVVNDGGEPAAVAEVVQRSGVDPRRVRIVHHAQSLGMEAASNSGIRESRAELVVIHDDDDSWRPAFLERAVAFLSEGAGAHYGGVITGTEYVEETLEGTAVIETERRPYNDWVEHVQLAEMATGNFFPPIAFVFRRSVYDAIGGFDETLPVLGDWDFNLRFLMHSDIGVIREPLAGYHHRSSVTWGPYSNSVIGGISKHAEYNAVVRNRLIRRFPQHAAFLAGGYFQQDVRGRTAGAWNAASANSTLMLRRFEEVAGLLKSRPTESRESSDAVWLELVRLSRGQAPEELGDAPTEESEVESTGVPILDAETLWGKPREWLDRAVREGRIPWDVPAPPDFDADVYLQVNGDVARAVSSGAMPSAYYHFVVYGRSEGRMRPRRGSK